MTAEISGISLIEGLEEATRISGAEAPRTWAGETLTRKGNAVWQMEKGLSGNLIGPVVALRFRISGSAGGSAIHFESRRRGSWCHYEEVQISCGDRVPRPLLGRSGSNRSPCFGWRSDGPMGKRILYRSENEWIEVSSRGFMFHSVGAVRKFPSGDSVSRPEAGIGGEQPTVRGSSGIFPRARL